LDLSSQYCPDKRLGFTIRSRKSAPHFLALFDVDNGLYSRRQKQLASITAPSCNSNINSALARLPQRPVE
jgi:hypothetical protein